MKKTLKKYTKFYKQIDTLISLRTSALTKHFPDLLDAKEGTPTFYDQRYKKIAVKYNFRELTHVNCQLGSSLMFSKKNFNKQIEVVLKEFKLANELEQPTEENLRIYFKIKNLLGKMYEKRYN